MDAEVRRRTFERLARAGYAARGAVYVLAGLCALAGIAPGGAKDTLRLLLTQPYGRAILGALAVGLAGFSLWRLAQGLLDADARGTHWRALAERGTCVLSGGAYAATALYAASLALGRVAGGGDDEGVRDWTARAMALPAGTWLVAGIAGAAALACLGVTLGALSHRFRARRRMDSAPDWAIILGRAGQAAFGLLFAVAAGSAAAAALRADPSEARGLPGALDALASAPHGALAFTAGAAGLLAFGAFNLAQARWRRIPAPDPVDAARRAGRAAASAAPRRA
jgi:hypothetical protein